MDKKAADSRGYCREQMAIAVSKGLNDFQAGQLIVKAPGPLLSRLTLQAFTKHKHPLIRKHIGAKTEWHFNDMNSHPYDVVHITIYSIIAPKARLFQRQQVANG